MKKSNIFQAHIRNPRDRRKNLLVYSVDKDREKVEYFLNPESAQYKWIKKITITGFTRLPPGFKKNGKGLTRSRAYLLVKNLFEELGNFNLIISSSGKNTIRKMGNKYRVTLNYNDFRLEQLNLSSISKENYELQRISVINFLNRVFPKRFKRIKEEGLIYHKNQFRNLLNKEDIIKNLSNRDTQSLIDFFPAFIKYYGDVVGGKDKLIGISKNIKITKSVYLENVIKEFRRKINAKTQNEYRWQEFLRKYILIFNSSYISILEKANISLPGNYPDFLPINVYGYLDIYEIKKPNTTLLLPDRGRKNYYWSSELSKAISQVENYIDQINKNSYALEKIIRDSKGIKIRIVGPRGFIIAGKKSQLSNNRMKDNFRLLNNSLKNIEIVLYDELLDNLRNFLKRLKK